jgi:signal transduction histidine kinase
MRVWQVARAVAGIMAVLLVLVACWSVAYLLTARIYDRVGHAPADFVAQLINSLAGFFLFGMLMAGFSLLTQIRQKQMALVQSMNEALHRIARGDFSVNLKPSGMADKPFGELVESINHMAGELNQMEQLRQEFVSNVSHEIQSPLTSIGGFARALQSDELDREERLHYLTIIEAESTRLARLSDNLLKLTALESEHPPFEPTRYRLHRQLRDVILSLEPQWAQKSLELDVSLHDVSITADQELVSQVWMNLLGNSIKFTPEGGMIRIVLRRCDPHAVVSIVDAGIGIGEGDQARIFERFYKADRSRDRSAGGSGLGLAIARKIVDLHGGVMQVESALGKGTSMTVRLPIG